MVLIYKKDRESIQELKELLEEFKTKYFGKSFVPINLGSDGVRVKAYGIVGERKFPGLDFAIIKYENIQRIEFTQGNRQIQIDTITGDIILIHKYFDGKGN